MLVDIKDISGKVLFSTPINEGSKRRFQLMQEDFINLKFSLKDPIYFNLGDGIDNEIGMFELIDLYKPIYNEDTGGYDYDLRLDAYYWKWKNKKFFYTPKDGGREAGWSLTDTIETHLNVFLRNLSELGYTYRDQPFKYHIDETVSKSLKLISYENTNLIDALTMMAETWECEWWITDNWINFGRCEHGTPINFTIGDNVNTMKRNDSQSTYATRIYAFGSTRNIPYTYRKDLIFDVREVNGRNISDTTRILKNEYFPISSKKESNLKIVFPENAAHIFNPPASASVAQTTPVGSLEAGKYEIKVNNIKYSTIITHGDNLTGKFRLRITLKYTVNSEEKTSILLDESIVANAPLDKWIYLEIENKTLAFTLDSKATNCSISAEVSVGYNTSSSYAMIDFVLEDSDIRYGYANTALVTFTSGANKGKTYESIYNPTFLLDDFSSNIIRLPEGVTASLGDHFTIDNIIKGKVPERYFSLNNPELTQNGVVQSRLMLPAGVPYIDAYQDMTKEEIVEEIVIFEDIYPKYNGTVNSVDHKIVDEEDEGGNKTGKTYPIYTFKDTGIKNLTEDFMLEEQLHVIFQTGRMAGFRFAVNMKSDSTGTSFEIIRNSDYGRSLPDELVYPQTEHIENGATVPADTYILEGFDPAYLSESMIPDAELELQKEAEKYIEKSKIDPSTYDCDMNISSIYNDGNIVVYELGDRVNLINNAYFDNGRQSRIIGFEYNIDILYDHLVYIVGETPAYSRLGEIESKIDTLTYKGQSYQGTITGGSGSGVYVIGVNDKTNPTNRNVYSALNSDSRYISKQHNDIASGHITFEQGIYVKGRIVGDGQSILEEDNSILEEDNGIIEEVVSEPAPTPLTLGGLDNVNDIVDNPSNKDVILVRKAGSLEWTQEDKSISETIPEAPKDGKQYARQDGAWSVVKATSVDVPTKLSQLENDADYVQDPDYIHTDNNFTSLLKDQLSKLTTEYLNDANKLNYQRSRAFFSKTHADTSSVWGFVRYFNNLPTLTATQVKITGVRSDFNGDLISDSYVNIPGATQTLAGIMTAADKTKLDGIEAGATRVIVDSLMSETSLNPVQNKVITSKIIQIEGRTTGLETQYSTLSNTLSPIKAAWDKRGTKDGLLLLGDNNLIPSQYLPSYVDDVVDVYATYDKSATGVLSNIKLYTNAAHTTAVVPETGKIYIDITSGKPSYQFRWSGTTYIDLNTGGLILGTIAGTAFEGDKGNILYTNFGEGDNLLYTQKARDFFKSLAVGVSFISNLEVGSVSETSANLVYDSNVFGATTNRITFALPVADSNKAGIISAYDKIFIDDIKSKVGEFVTLDTPQTITEVKKITSYLSFVSGTRKINISGNGIEMYSYPSGGSAQSIKFCDSNGNLLSSFGYMVNDNTLNSVYLGTGYEESKHWVTFTPSKTTIRGKAEVKGSLMISPGASGLNGIIATNGNGLLMYGDDATYLSQNTGITYIRSGNENLYHTKAGNNYIILDQINTPHVFCRKGEASASHVDLTDTTANAVGFVDYTSGAYRVSRNGSTAMYIKFQGSGSTSGLELYTNYVGGASLQFRKIVDNNRISGAWSYLLDDRNWNRYVKFDSLTDKPFISVDATPNSLVKRTSTGFINCNLAGVTFYDTAYSTNPQNGWVITTATNYGKTSKDLKIKQYVGTGGNLFLNDYRVATAKDKYVMSKYTIDASNLDEDTYYPVTIKLNSGHNYRIEVLVQLDSGTKPSWSTHNSGFAVRFIEEIQGYGWGTINTIRKIIDFEYSHCIGGSYPVKRVMQMTNSSTEVIYVRGGGRYFFFVSGSSFNAPEPILRTSTYTENSQSVSPTPSADLVFNVSRNIIMSDDVAIEPVGGKIAQRDVNGYLRAIRYYTTTPAEDYAISHIAFFYNSDGYIRKTPLSGLNRQLMFGSLNGLITYNTEHNFIPDNFNNDVWINNRTTAGSSANTTINEYRFRNGNSSGEYSYLRARGFIKQSSNDRYALTGAGGHMLITYDGTANALVQRDASGNVTANSYFFQGSSAKIGPNCIELYSSTTPYIDFHYGNSSDDYTTRIIEDGKSHLQIYANVGVRVSGNITAPGFDRVGSSDSFVLLGGGGHKLVSEFVDRTSNQNISGFKNFFTTATDGNYGTRAIVLRETNMGKDANKSELYAPSLSFHWGNVAQAVMSMHTNGQIYFTQTTTDGNAIYVNARGYVKNDSDNDHALTGGGGHVPFSIDATAHSLVKRTSDGSIRAKDVISSNYVLHTDVNNPYLRLRSVSTDYFIQAYESGIWMGPADTAKSLIISSTGNAGLGILPNDSYKLYVNGNIRSSNTINAGEVVNMAYGYINVSRPKTIENASCFSWIRETTSAFALGFNSSNQIVLGQGKTDKTLTPWLKIGASSSQFQSHLNTQTVSTEYGEFNHDLGRMLSTTATVTGIICITLPQGWIYSMNMYEIYIYEYTNTVCGSRILISGYNYGATPAWVNCKYTSEGNYSRSVRLGYKGGKCCILLGDIDSVWAYPQVFLANVYNGYSGLGSWKTGYTIGVITSTSDVTNIVTVQRSYSNAAGFMKDGSSDSYVLLGAGGHLSYSESATSNSLVKRSGNGYIFGKFFHSDNPVQDTLTVTNLFFETGSDGYHRKASLGHVTDTMRVATQTLKGLMSAEDKKKVDLFDPSKYIRRDIDDDALGHLTFHAGIYVDGGVYSGQSILEADGVNGIMEANGNNIIEYSEPAPIATSMTLGELTNVSSSVNTAASSKVMLVKGAGETLWTQEVITPNILKGFADTRTVATTPNDYNSKFSVVGIKQNSKIGSPNSETYSYLIGYRGWSDSSGGKSHELGFNNQGIYHRIGSTTAWESWEKILTSANWNSFITIPVIPDMSTYAKKDFSNVTTQSLGQNGYCKFPNGLLIQWGKNTSTITIRIVSLPTPFLDGNYIVTANMSSTSVTEEVSDIRIGNKTTEAFSVRIPTQPSGNTSSENFEWIAIGRWK